MMPRAVHAEAIANQSINPSINNEQRATTTPTTTHMMPQAVHAEAIANLHSALCDGVLVRNPQVWEDVVKIPLERLAVEPWKKIIDVNEITRMHVCLHVNESKSRRTQKHTRISQKEKQNKKTKKSEKTNKQTNKQKKTNKKKNSIFHHTLFPKLEALGQITNIN